MSSFQKIYPELKDKVALVTGGASGIGLATCLALSAAGVKVSIVDIDKEKGVKTVKKIGGIYIEADLTKQGDCKRAVEETEKKLGGLDILVNNAGVQYVSPIVDFPEEKWNKMIGLMLTAPFLLIKYSWPYMVSQGFGRIVNISSVHGLVASIYKSAYVAAKHGLIGLTKCVALEGAQHGITANSICPSYVRTPLVKRQIDELARLSRIKKDKVIREIMLKDAAIKRLIEPEEIAELVLYLCSDKALSVTGSSWTVDLGWTAH